MVPNQISSLELIQAQVSFIPEGWKLDKVGNALAIKNTFRKPINQEVRSTMPGVYPYYGPTKIQDYISEYEQDGTYALIGEDGDHFLKYSAMKQTQFIHGKCTVNNHAHILDSTKTCDSEWFYIFFKHRNITNFLSRQGAGRFKLNKATLEKLPLLVPPINEQRKIAKILAVWDKAINTTERLIDNSKQQKKALMQQLLTGKKRLFDDSNKSFEGEWHTKKLSDLFTFSTASSKTKFIDDSGENFILDMGSVSRAGKLIPSKRTRISKDYLTEGQLVMPKDDIGGGQIIGRVGYVNKSEKYILSDHVYCLTPKSGSSLFFSYLINYHEVNKQLRRKANGTAQLGLGKKDAEKQPVCIPKDKAEQHKIASVLSNADKEIELLEKQLADLKQEKKALMQQLLTGKRRVKLGEGEAA